MKTASFYTGASSGAVIACYIPHTLEYLKCAPTGEAMTMLHLQ